MKQRGFILPSGLTLYATIGALAIIALLGVALWVQTGRVETWKGKHDTLVTQVKTLGEQAKAHNKRKEQDNERVLADVSKAWKGSLDAAVSGAVQRYRVRNPSSGGCSVPSIAGDPQAPDGASQEPMATRPDDGFIQDCAADAIKIDSFQTWARGIGFPVK